MVGASEIIAGAALLVSGYSMWSSKLTPAKLKVLVPPVIAYASPYQNSNFEAFEVPVTLVNEGARTGTVLSIDLEVTDPRTKATKRFYSADFGRWSLERTNNLPFAPLSLAGHTRQTETVLFHTRGDDEKPDQMVYEKGPYSFRLILDDGSDPKRRPSVTFVRELRGYNGQALVHGTLPMFATDWRSSTNE